MPGILDGKVAIVTGSTDGIGFAIAKRLARDGASVVVSSRRQKNVDRAVADIRADGGKVYGTVCHVANQQHRDRLIQETLSEFGGIDIFVSNVAASPAYGPILDTTEDMWDKIFDVNVKSYFFFAKEVIPHMEERGGGSVVFISSVLGYDPQEVLGAYSVSKTALIGLVKAMMPQCTSKNIRVNGVAPGIIKTNFNIAVWSDPEIEKEVNAKIPMNRLGLPHEVAGGVSFLVSEDASYITGETLVISGGMHSRL